MSMLMKILPVEVVELAPKLKDEEGNEIDGSEKPDTAEDVTNAMVKENPNDDRIAHREIKIRIGGGGTLEGKEVTWSMEPLFAPEGQEDPIFRGDWADSANHSDRFESSQTYGAYDFSRTSQEQGKTTIDAQGYSAIRVNLPPIGFNRARINIEIEDASGRPIKAIDVEVPAVVVIDPGHGGPSTPPSVGGSSWNNATANPSGILEKTMTLDYGLLLRDRLKDLRSQGKLHLWIHMTRDSDVNLGSCRSCKCSTRQWCGHLAKHPFQWIQQ